MLAEFGQTVETDRTTLTNNVDDQPAVKDPESNSIGRAIGSRRSNRIEAEKMRQITFPPVSVGNSGITLQVNGQSGDQTVTFEKQSETVTVLPPPPQPVQSSGNGPITFVKELSRSLELPFNE